MQPGAARIRRGLVAFDDERKIAFEEFVGTLVKPGHSEWPSGTVAHRPAGDTAEADLEQLEPFPDAVGARIEEVRTRRKAGGVEEFGRLLTQQTRPGYVEDPAERMRAARQRGGIVRLEQRTLRDADLDQVVETVVEQDLRVEDHDHVDAEEHLEHVLVEVEIDRRRALRIGAGEIEHDRSPSRHIVHLILIGAEAHAVVADVILELTGASPIEVAISCFIARWLRASSSLGRGDVEVLAEPPRPFRCTRRAATRHEAISALRSAAHQSGLRDWCMTSRIRSGL